MSKKSLALAFLPLLLSMPAAASVVADPEGDILDTFVGVESPDLDVTSFSVVFDSSVNNFVLEAVFAGPINPATNAFDDLTIIEEEFQTSIIANDGRGQITIFESFEQPVDITAADFLF